MWVIFVLEPAGLLGACKPGSQAHMDSRTGSSVDDFSNYSGAQPDTLHPNELRILDDGKVQVPSYPPPLVQKPASLQPTITSGQVTGPTQMDHQYANSLAEHHMTPTRNAGLEAPTHPIIRVGLSSLSNPPPLHRHVSTPSQLPPVPPRKRTVKFDVPPASNLVNKPKPFSARSLTPSLNSNIGLNCASAPGLFDKMNKADDVWPEVRRDSRSRSMKRTQERREGDRPKRNKNY